MIGRVWWEFDPHSAAARDFIRDILTSFFCRWVDVDVSSIFI